MQFFAIALSLLVSSALAIPANLDVRGGGGDGGGDGSGGDGGGTTTTYDGCSSGLFGVKQCCDVDVLGVADLDCAAPSDTPTSLDNFAEVCADVGKIDRCCILPILGQDLLCTDPAAV